jgi:NAD(P)H-nitrite reductase large subunit
MQAEQFTAYARRVVNQEKKDAFNQAIKTCLAMHEAEIERIAKEHAKKTQYVWCLLNHATNYTSNCQPSFYNALVHHMAKELNDGENQDILLFLNLN